jgi:hypothetical protein
MDTPDYKNDLEERIAVTRRRLREELGLASALMKTGKPEHSTHDTICGSYKRQVELLTLLQLYNAHFKDPMLSNEERELLRDIADNRKFIVDTWTEAINEAETMRKEAAYAWHKVAEAYRDIAGLSRNLHKTEKKENTT